MAVAARPIRYEDRLTLVEHLGELRARLLVCVAGFVVAFGVAMWQNHALLDVVNAPLRHTTAAAAERAPGPLGRAARFDVGLREALRRDDLAFARLALSAAPLSGPDRAALAEAAGANRRALAIAGPRLNGRQPVTLGLGEPFTQTLTVSAYFALLFSLPLLLYQAYAFVLPAFTPRQRRLALPLMALVPVLFAAGVLFAYFLVLPAAIGFLQNFNAGQFDVLIQARTLYQFTLLTTLMVGLVFQMPVGILALTKLGVVTPRQLRRNWRYATVIIAVIAVLLPGTDPVTTVIEMVPLLLLYAFSIALATWAERVGQRKRSG
ncbi:MAG: twin-arginine translocase subunit TatC [Actinomycetota bacterium]|nr:twin-arginine translocase subunit TatC [Actinomycetota bacterium]